MVRKHCRKITSCFATCSKNLIPAFTGTLQKTASIIILNWVLQKLKDSLTEYKFRNVLSYVLAKIHCGHTSVRASRLASRYAERTRGIQFPLSIKAWDDTVVITSNLSRKDSMVARGSLLTSIDGRPIQTIVDSFFQYLSADGYNTTHKYQTLSNSGVFRSMYGSILWAKIKNTYRLY